MKESSFAKVIAEHKRTIYTVCYMFSNDNDEINDLFQDILENLWKGFDKFEGRSDIRTWIYRVGLNTCISSRRKKNRNCRMELSLDIDLFDYSDEENRQIGMLHDRISRLKPFDRAIVLLWLENIPYEEIGMIVGISAQNVGTRLYRIKEQLKRMSNE